MNPVLLKGFIGAGIVGGIAGLGIGGHYLFKTSEPTTLKEKFQKENIQVLDYETKNIAENGDAKSYLPWIKKAEEYKQEKNKNKRFDELTVGNLTSFESLRAKCKEILEKPVAETKDLETKIKQWCTTSANTR